MDGIQSHTHSHTHTHTHTNTHSKTWTYAPGGVMDNCILQSQPAGSTVSQAALWALIGQSVLPGVATANHETVSWRAAPNLLSFARHSILGELFLARY